MYPKKKERKAATMKIKTEKERRHLLKGVTKCHLLQALLSTATLINDKITLGLGLPMYSGGNVYNVSTLGMLCAPGPWEDPTSTWSENMSWTLHAPPMSVCMTI